MMLSARFAQWLIVACAAIFAIYIGLRGGAASTNSAGFDMLAYLDAQVAAQEDAKDVRCWSSFCKLQMFLAGAPIDEDAIALRIEKHMELIDSIWQSAVRESPGASCIGSEAVAAVLSRRFPHKTDATGAASFQLMDPIRLINVELEAVTDYSDTIEPWRLIQTWAARQTDASGVLTLSPPLGQPALNALRDFLKTYDLAILRHARQIAHQNKKATIDSASMWEAFDMEAKLRPGD